MRDAARILLRAGDDFRARRTGDAVGPAAERLAAGQIGERPSAAEFGPERSDRSAVGALDEASGQRRRERIVEVGNLGERAEVGDVGGVGPEDAALVEVRRAGIGGALIIIRIADDGPVAIQGDALAEAIVGIVVRIVQDGALRPDSAAFLVDVDGAGEGVANFVGRRADKNGIVGDRDGRAEALAAFVTGGQACDLCPGAVCVMKHVCRRRRARRRERRRSGDEPVAADIHRPAEVVVHAAGVGLRRDRGGEAPRAVVFPNRHAAGSVGRRRRRSDDDTIAADGDCVAVSAARNTRERVFGAPG